MKKVLNFLMVLLMVMGLGMASGMTAFQAEAAETSGETALAANQDGDKGADAKKAASGIYDEANLLSEVRSVADGATGEIFFEIQCRHCYRDNE